MNSINVTHLEQINYALHIPEAPLCRLILYRGDGQSEKVRFRRALAALLLPGQSFILTPDVSLGNAHILSFPAELLSDQQLSEHAEPILFPDPPDAYISYIVSSFNLLDQVSGSSAAYHTAISLSQWFLQLLPQANEAEPASSHARVLVEQAREIIHRDYANDLTLQAIAAQLFVNPCYLSTVFHQVTGTTFRAYLKQIRLQHACRLLTQTNHLITDIAMQTGFNSTAYLISSFRKEYGVTPNVYRSQNAKR